jgi:hypothetical protein
VNYFFNNLLHCTTLLSSSRLSPLFPDLFFNSLVAFAANMASEENEGKEMAYSDAYKV